MCSPKGIPQKNTTKGEHKGKPQRENTKGYYKGIPHRENTKVNYKGRTQRDTTKDETSETTVRNDYYLFPLFHCKLFLFLGQIVKGIKRLFSRRKT